MQAIVYVRTEPGKALKLLDRVRELHGVKFAAATTGRFDIVIRVEVQDLTELGSAVVDKIQKLPGVTYTETSMIVA
ncbi:MAG: Lrp/AsnC ligand binding domain-containing protein [Candidatus Hadarchaeales archaeon]